MQGEFEASVADARPLSFALGCLVAAVRQMPGEAEGRFALASHALAIGLILPLAALLSAGAVLGFPYLDFAHDDLFGILSIQGAPSTLLNDGNRAAASSLSLVMILLAGASVLIGWAILDRDWARVAACERFLAAAASTLTIVTALLGFDVTRLILPIMGFTTEHVAVLLLLHWHCGMSGEGATMTPNTHR